MPQFLIIGLLLSLQTFSFKGQDNASYAVSHISKDLTSKAHAIIRNDQTIIRLDSEKKYTASYRKVITIMSKKGDSYADFVQHYKKGSSKIDDVKISIFDAQGKLIRKVKSSELEDYASRDGSMLISDGRVTVFDFEPTDYPVTIDMSWSEESSNTLSLPAWWPLSGPNVSVEKSSYEVLNNAKIELRVGERNLSNYPIKRISAHKYEMTDQSVVFRESYTPSVFDRYPIVNITPVSYQYEGYKGSYSTWDELGKWMYRELLAKKADLNPAIVKRDLAPLLKGVTDKREIVKILYDYVQQNTRYIFIGLDEGGYVPLSAKKVHDVKYGDCKALSFYMKTLLDAYDIPANYVVIRAGTSMPEDIFEDYPHMTPANHVIINVPMEKDTIWLDCTSHDNPFNFLGDFTDDRLALQINAEGGRLVRTPAFTKDQNKDVRRAEVNLDKTGDVSIDLSIDEYGVMFDKVIYLKKLDQKELDEYLSTQLFGSFDKVDVTVHEFDLNEELVMTNQHYELSASKYGEIAGDYMILDASLLPMSIPKLKKDSKRDNEIYFPRARQSVADVTYHLPDGYRWDLPEDIQLDSDYGSYIQKVTELNPGSYQVHRAFTLFEGTHPSANYKEIKLFFDKIRKAESSKFSVTKKS